MRKETLEAVGLRTNYDIPADELFAATFESARYGLDSGSVQTLRCLRDFVREYNRELPVDSRVAVRNSATAAELMRSKLRGLDHEECWAVLVDGAMKTLGSRCLTTGGLDATIIDRKMLLRYALEMNAKGVILYHNHPSGDPQPSAQDVNLTEQLRNALNVFEMLLVDHVVISDSCYYSFAEGRKASYDTKEKRRDTARLQ